MRRPLGRLHRIRRFLTSCLLGRIPECILALIGPRWVTRTRTIRSTPRERNITLVRWRIAATVVLPVLQDFHEAAAEVGEGTVGVATITGTETTIITIAIDHTQDPGREAEAVQGRVAVDHAAAVEEVAQVAVVDGPVAEAGAAVPVAAAVDHEAVVDLPEGPDHVDPNRNPRNRSKCPNRRPRTWLPQ